MRWLNEELHHPLSMDARTTQDDTLTPKQNGRNQSAFSVELDTVEKHPLNPSLTSETRKRIQEIHHTMRAIHKYFYGLLTSVYCILT